MDYVIRFLAGGVVVSLFASSETCSAPKALPACSELRLRCACNAYARVLEAWRRLCLDGRPVDDHRRNRACGLQFSRLPAPDAPALLRADGDAVATVAWLIIAVGLKQAVLG